MKKTLSPLAISLLFAAFLTLVSCTREEIEPPSVEDLLIGKWTMDAAITDNIDNGINTTDTTWFTADDYFDFKADGTVSIMAGTASYNGNWKIEGNKLIFTNTQYVDFRGGFDLGILTQSDLQLYYTLSVPPDHHTDAKLTFKR